MPDTNYTATPPKTTTTATTTASVSTSDSSTYLLPAVLATVLLLTFFVLLSTGSILAVGVLWVILAMVGFLLSVYGFITADILAPVLATPAVQPVGSATSSLTNVNIMGSEVFHISDNKFTYDDAPAVCAAYGTQLASLEQIIDAYNHGAEWCGYGWSAGGMALYPTQKGTWDALQQEVDQAKKTACGRPGVNGGYFDPSSKFGVNCYGIKPQGNVKLPTPLPGTDHTAFNGAVAKFKSMIKSFNLDPYSRSTWSASPGQQFLQSATKEHFAIRERLDVPDMEVMPGHTIANTAGAVGAPYGLMGDVGPTGSTGPSGPTGPSGSDGSPSSVPGPTGPAGRGLPGTPSTVPGPTGPSGPKGDEGKTGKDGTASNIAGKTGDKGAKGDKGDRGDNAKPLAAITEVLYGARGISAPEPAARQALINGMQEGHGFQMHQAPGVGDPLPNVGKSTVIKWDDNAGGHHVDNIDGNGIGTDVLSALNRRFAYPGPAKDLRYTGTEVV